MNFLLSVISGGLHNILLNCW